MPHKHHNRKDSSSTSDCSSDSCSADCCGQNRCSDTSFSCSSDSSCPNFSSLCKDSSKSCTSISECTDKPKKSHKKSHKKTKKCKGCKSKCKRCDECKACGCYQCSDVSVSSVLSSLSCSSDSSCPDFSSLCKDSSKSCESISECSEKSKKHQKRSHKKSHKTASGKKFDVTFGDKQGHCHSHYNPGNQSIHINGKNGPTLHLYRGKTYYFDVQQPGAKNCMTAEHCFVLTQSPVGNYHGIPPIPLPNSFQPTASGTVSYKVTEQTPNYFYYQCSKHAFEGGLCLVHDLY